MFRLTGFPKPATPAQKRAKRVAHAKTNIARVMGLVRVEPLNAAPLPPTALSEDSGPFIGAQSSAAGNADGIKRLLWRT